MKRLANLVRRFIAAIGRPFAWIWRQIRWLWHQIRRLLSGLVGPLFDWIGRGLAAVKGRIEGAIDWLLDVVARIFRGDRNRERVKEERIGANGTPLLATLTLALVWYFVPLARWFGYGPTRFVLVGLVIWVVALISWLSRCRADRTGRVAQFAQRVCRSTGLRRFDQWMLLPALWLCYLTLREVQLLPLAFASLIAVLALLAVEHEFRPQLVAPRAPAFVVPVTVPAPSPTGSTVRRELRWSVTAHGRPHDHHATIDIDTAAVEAARSANPGNGGDDEIVRWVEHGVGPEIESLAHQIHDQCFTGGYSLFATVSSFVAASQVIRYVSDEESTGRNEYWRYPIETLADGIGDCEDSAILLAALLRRSGFRCAIILAPIDGDTDGDADSPNRDGHAAVAVEVPHDAPGAYFERDGVRYYYCETTNKGWKIGEVPNDIELDEATFVRVPDWEGP